MKLLVDQNISHRFCSAVKTEDIDAVHVKELGLINALDKNIYAFATNNGFDAIITQDSDFHRLLIEYGCPPKVIWFRTRNQGTAILVGKFLGNLIMVKDFIQSPDLEVLEIY